MKNNKLVFLIIALCCASSCKVENTIGSSLSESQKNCLKYNQKALSEIFETYQNVRHNNNVMETIDSIMTTITFGVEQDTLFIIESCSRPLFLYHAIIWDKDNVFTLSGSGSLEKKVFNENDSKIMRLVERWDKDEILSISHQKPLIYDGMWFRSCIASRIVMEWGKCVAIESIFFQSIDFDVDVTPVLFD